MNKNKKRIANVGISIWGGSFFHFSETQSTLVHVLNISCFQLNVRLDAYVSEMEKRGSTRVVNKTGDVLVVLKSFPWFSGGKKQCTIVASGGQKASRARPRASAPLDYFEGFGKSSAQYAAGMNKRKEDTAHLITSINPKA